MHDLAKFTHDQWWKNMDKNDNCNLSTTNGYNHGIADSINGVTQHVVNKIQWFCTI